MFKDFNDQTFLSTIKGRVYGDKKYETFLSDWSLYKNKPTKTTLDSLINFFKFYVLLPWNKFLLYVNINTQTQNITVQIS
jgi:hypothetical protein